MNLSEKKLDRRPNGGIKRSIFGWTIGGNVWSRTIARETPK